MIIAQKKRRENVVEYLLYMWQIEDLIRANNLDIETLDKRVIAHYNQSEEKQQEIRNWYERLIQMMQEEGVAKAGHIYLVRHLMDELQDLHVRLINNNDKEYLQLYQQNFDHLQALRKKMSDSEKNDVETILTGMYGAVLLKLQNKSVTDDTQAALSDLSKLANKLAEKFKAYETGKLELN